MRGFKPDQAIWERVNKAVLGENAAVVAVTIISGLCNLLVVGGAAPNEEGARILLAAMVLSPDDGTAPGALIPRLQAECTKLDDGKWRQ